MAHEQTAMAQLVSEAAIEDNEPNFEATDGIEGNAQEKDEAKAAASGAQEVEPEPRWYVIRPDDSCVPLIPIDELASGVRIHGLPQVLNRVQQSRGVFLGRFPVPSIKYRWEILQPVRGPGTGSGSVVRPPPSGMWPDESQKEYCGHWLFTGKCSFMQQGCIWKHEMPTDRAVLQRVGLNGEYPRWYLRKMGLEARENRGGRGQGRGRGQRGGAHGSRAQQQQRSGSDSSSNRSAYRISAVAAATVATRPVDTITTTAPVHRLTSTTSPPAVIDAASTEANASDSNNAVSDNDGEADFDATSAEPPEVEPPASLLDEEPRNPALDNISVLEATTGPLPVPWRPATPPKPRAIVIPRSPTPEYATRFAPAIIREGERLATKDHPWLYQPLKLSAPLPPRKEYKFWATDNPPQDPNFRAARGANGRGRGVGRPYRGKGKGKDRAQE